MNTINFDNKQPNLQEINGGWYVNFSQQKTTVTERQRNDDGSEEEVEKEVYKVYQKFFKRIPTLRERRMAVIEGIETYDKSSAVNSFTYEGAEYWIDRETRVSVMNTVNILKAAGEKTATLWVGSRELTLPCDTIIGILSALEKYALQCYNVTQRHKAAVMEMPLEEAYEYDFEVGYPEKIVF